MSETTLGIVIRDPWYEFGTHPGFPNQPNYTWQKRMGEFLQLAGARWVRLEFHLDGDQVESQIARYDYFINEVAPQHNLQVLGLMGFGLLRAIWPLDPEGGLVSTRFRTDPVYGGGVNSYMRAWLDRARLIADRYRGAIHAYEILNEPNRLPPSGAGISAAINARLLTKFYRFFRQVDRAAPGDQSWRDQVSLLIGGLHPLGTGEPAWKSYISDLDYVYQLFESEAFRSYRIQYGRNPADGLAFHPYPVEIRNSLRRGPRRSDPAWQATMLAYRLDELRQVLRELGESALPFWITEVGYNAGFAGQSEAGQAAYLRSILGMLQARADIAASLWFKYEDFPPAGGPDAQQWGLVRIPFQSGACPGESCYEHEGRPEHIREAFYVFRELAARITPMRYRVVGQGGQGVVVRQGPGERFPAARIGADEVVLIPGFEIGIDRFVDGEAMAGWNQWAHLVEPAAWGFVPLSLIQPVGT